MLFVAADDTVVVAPLEKPEKVDDLAATAETVLDQGDAPNDADNDDDCVDGAAAND